MTLKKKIIEKDLKMHLFSVECKHTYIYDCTHVLMENIDKANTVFLFFAVNDLNREMDINKYICGMSMPSSGHEAPSKRSPSTAKCDIKE